MLLGACAVAKMACECHGHSGWTHLDEFWWKFKFLNEHILLLFDTVVILVDDNEILDGGKNIIWFCLEFYIGNIDYMGFIFFYWAKRAAWCKCSACRLWTERSQVRAVASTHCTVCGKDLPLITSPRPRTVREPTALGTSYIFYWAKKVA